jgi:hypothetical protein
MRPIYENTVIQIDVTNACHLSCRHCTRHVGHHRKPFFMDLDTVRRAILSLDGFPGRVGIMGGEPTLHPRFADICALVRELIPDRRRREFWTAGFRWGEHKATIYETFDSDRINYNDHVAYDGKHTPLLVAIEEVVDDLELRAELIENCSFQTHWSASITPKGAFFCEIAASLDWLMDGPGGYPIEPGWWRKTPADFKDQVDRYCGQCSGAIPMPAYSDGRGGRDGPTIEQISPGNVERLRALGSRKVMAGHYEVWEKKITRADVEAHAARNPRAFRSFVARNPEDVKNALDA